MQLNEMFRDQGDMERHLAGIFCKYKDKWIWIAGTYSWLIKFYYVESYKIEAKVKDLLVATDSRNEKASDFDFRNYHIGYMNRQAGLHYFVRKSAQLQQESISTANLVWPHGTYSHGHEVQDPGFYKMLNREYPSLEEAWSQVSLKVPTKSVALAFESKLALKRLAMSMVNVEYMGKPIGEMPLSSSPSPLTLYPSAQHLKRYVQQVGGLQVQGSL